MSVLALLAIMTTVGLLTVILLVVIPAIVRTHEREQRAIERAVVVQSANRQIRQLNQATLEAMYSVAQQSIGSQR